MYIDDVNVWMFHTTILDVVSETEHYKRNYYKRNTQVQGAETELCTQQSDPLNSYSLNSSFSLNSSGKFENFESVIIDTNIKSTF